MPNQQNKIIKFRSGVIMRKAIQIILIITMLLMVSSAIIFADETAQTENVGCIINKISVRSEDGDTVTGAFTPGGFLEKITLQNTSSDVISGSLYVAISDKRGVLKYAALKEVEDTGESDEINIDFTRDNFRFDDEIRNSRVSLFLWDSNLAPISKKYSWENVNNWSVYFNDCNILPDCLPIYKADGEIYVGVKYLLNLMGITLEKYGDAYYAKRDFDNNYISYSIGDSYVTTNKGIINLNEKIAYSDDGFVLLPVSILETVFGCRLESVDDINSEIYLSYPEEEYTANYQIPGTDGYVTKYISGTYSSYYEISNVEDIKDIEVWYKPTYPDSISSFNNIDFNRSMDTRYWHKAINPILREDGVYIGSLSYLKVSTYYSVKYVLKGNDGSEKIYVDRKAFKTSPKKEITMSELMYNADTLSLNATYENMGYYINYESIPNSESCEVTYRQIGEPEWHRALEPFDDTLNKQFRGSIVNLNDNTTYEVKTIIKDKEGNELNTQIASTTTWNNEPNIGETISLDKFTSLCSKNDKTITEPVQIVGVNGTEENWIKIDCKGWTLETGYNTESALNIDNCKYVIIDGITVKGGYKCGIAVNDSCEYVRISDCDVSEFGKTGFQRDNGFFYRDGTLIDYDAGVLMLGSSYITVENCYIHDPVTKTNPWKSADDRWQNSHPYGVSGIYYHVFNSCVIRYNDIVGNELHRWNDGIEGVGNATYTGGPARDTDIYGNMIAYGQDDGIELDGGQMNIRVYNNRIEQFKCAVSLVPNLFGPSYLFNNIIVNMGSETEKYGKAFKAGGGQNNSFSYIFNNTCFLYGVISENTDKSGSKTYNFVTRNNIFVNTAGGTCYRNSENASINNNNFDFCYGQEDFSGYVNGGSSIMYPSNKHSINSIYTKLNFVNHENGVLNLTPDSECYENGTYIDNFCEIENPNIGALQSENDFMPYRPIGIYADRYYVDLSDTYAGNVTINKAGDIPYEICKAYDMGWLDITTSKIDGNVSVNLSVNETQNGLSRSGIILFKLNDGYSIPITVCINN